jgi:hypothetical protein
MISISQDGGILMRSKLTKELHGNNLLVIFPDALIKDPVTLVNKLIRLDRKGQRISLASCNGEISEKEFIEKTDAICAKAKKLLNTDRVFDETDPRGCLFLKVELRKDEELARDFGGDGIIAPHF